MILICDPVCYCAGEQLFPLFFRKGANMIKKPLGQVCKEYRESMGYLQSDVAIATGYSKETVSAFECGRTNNAKIFAWYVVHGFGEYEMRGVKDEKRKTI